jgi:hypothetical protein
VQRPLLLQRIGGHEVDELDHAGRIDGRLAIVLGQPRWVVREIEHGDVEVRTTQPRVGR